jgi:sec-independent protein translocase protein TatC
MDSEPVPAPEGEELLHAEMTLFGHLAELRSVLLQSVLAVTVATTAAWFVSDQALELLVDPAVASAGDLVFLTPGGAFMLRLKTAFGLGVFVAAPIVLWRTWSFVVPGLLKKERNVLFPVIVSSTVLFYAGALFAWIVMLPMSLSFLLGFSTESVRPMLSAEEYFSFAIRLTVAFGAVFQFPMVVCLLTYWEVLAPDFLKRHWRWGIVLVFVVSAVLTPPDVASQLLMAGPVLVLYFVSLGVALLIGRSQRKNAAKS